MSAFKVGQRVRIIAPYSPLRGREATIVNITPGCWSAGSLRRGVSPGAVAHELDVDGYGRLWRGEPPDRPVGSLIAYPQEGLSPLLDPGADAFMERIKRLGREPINEIEKVKA